MVSGLDLVDDRGRPVAEPVEVCFVLERSLACRQVRGGHLEELPEDWTALRIEGEDHGPLRLRRDEAVPRSGAVLSVTVPRKALLTVAWPTAPAGPRGAPGAPLTVSLYSPRDVTFREPLFRAQLAAGAPALRIPPGDFVASLVDGAHAPDLQRLTARPAARAQLTYRPRPGWSVVVRCLASGEALPAATGVPLPAASVRLSAAPGFGRAETVLATALSGSDGLALLSGIEAPLAGLEATHAGLLPASARGLVAAPGTFTVQAMTLARGGRLRATVSLHGRPVTGITCHVSDLERNAPGQDRELWSGGGAAHGVCLSAPLPRGFYKLAVELPPGSGRANRWVSIEPGQTTDEDVSLAPCRVSGQVRRGKEPLPGYTVMAQDSPSGLPGNASGGRADRAVTDDDGRYALTLWTPGRYALMVKTPASAPVSTLKLVEAQGDDEQQVDFTVNPAGLAGTVLDEKGSGVGGASVFVTFDNVATRVVTDGQGAFQADLQGVGTAQVLAGKKGYLRADPVAVPIAEDQPAQVTVLLRRDATAAGRVVNAAGVPVGGALVASVQTAGSGAVNLYDAARSNADGTFQVRVPPGLPHVFVSGPDCPLSPAELPLAARSDTQPAADAQAGDDGAAQEAGPASGTEAAVAAETGGAAVPSPSAEVQCPAVPASLALTVADPGGRPVTHAGLILRQGNLIVPQAVLALHLTLLGLPSETDGSGNIVLAGLAPGEYDLFLSSGASEETIAAGRANGFLTSLALAPLGSTELRVTVPRAAR